MKINSNSFGQIEEIDIVAAYTYQEDLSIDKIDKVEIEK